MANAKESLSVRVYEDYNTTALEDDLSESWLSMVFSTGLHGGFKEARLSVPMALDAAWQYLNRPGAAGRHFHHLEISDGIDVVWEGRIMDIELLVQSGFVGLNLTSFGYWSSMRDQYYDAADAGNTDWTAGGPHTVDDIIKEMITKECPDINGTADIEANTRDVVGIDLTDRGYPMDTIVDKLAPLSDSDNSVWYFSVWEDRKPYWTKRNTDDINWYLSVEDTERLSLNQQGKHLRNVVLPVVGTAEKTSSVDTDSTALYPRREVMLSLPSGIADAVANDAGKTALEERKDPRQDQGFTVKGHVYNTTPGRLSQAAGAGVEEKPKWWVRAGDVARIRDLVSEAAASGTLDDLRTFYLVETRYDAGRDVLEVQPDRPNNRLSVLLSRMSQLEKDK